MRKIIVAEHISLDGVVQAPGGPDEDRSGGFAFGGWTVPYSAEEVGKVILDLHARPFELVLGRHTYDIWSGYWPKVEAGNAIGDAFNGTVKHVVTHRPDSLEWKESNALVGDVKRAIQELKATDGPDLLTWGSSELVRQLLAAGLVDVLLAVRLSRGARKRQAALRRAGFAVCLPRRPREHLVHRSADAPSGA